GSRLELVGGEQIEARTDQLVLRVALLGALLVVVGGERIGVGRRRAGERDRDGPDHGFLRRNSGSFGSQSRLSAGQAGSSAAEPLVGTGSGAGGSGATGGLTSGVFTTGR